MPRRPGVLARSLAAFAAVFCGWLAGFLAYLAAANGSPHDQTVWASWTAAFCLAAWLLIGLPLAAANPDLSTLPRAAIAIAASGCAGAAMTAVFFFSLTPGPIPLLAFLTGAGSMLAYVIFWRALEP